MKKLKAIFLSVIVILLFLSACNHNGSNETNPIETTEQTEVHTEPSKTIDIDNAYYYKNNNWSNGVDADNIKSEAYLTTGDLWPELETGDLFVYNNIMYGYNMYYNGTSWIKDESLNGWGCKIANTDTTGMIHIGTIAEINHVPVVSMSYAFANIQIPKRTTIIIVPDSVIDITGLMQDATLTSNINIYIHDNLQKYEEAFSCKYDTKERLEDGRYVYSHSKQIKLHGASLDFMINLAANSKLGNVTVSVDSIN